MQSLRYQRVRELLKREIGEVIRREIPVGESGLISVHDVALSGDLKSAAVFVGIVWWAYGASRRSRFELDAQLPFSDEEEARR